MDSDIKGKAISNISKSDTWVVVFTSNIQVCWNGSCCVDNPCSLLAWRRIDTGFFVNMWFSRRHNQGLDSFRNLFWSQFWMVLHKIFFYQGCNTRHVRRGHTSTTHISVGIVIQRREDVPTRCCDIRFQLTICCHSPAWEIRQLICLGRWTIGHGIVEDNFVRSSFQSFSISFWNEDRWNFLSISINRHTKIRTFYIIVNQGTYCTMMEGIRNFFCKWYFSTLDQC